MPRSVLHLLAPGPVGGIESVVAMLAMGQAEAGSSVGVALSLAPSQPLPPSFEPLEAAGVRVDRILVPPRRYLSEARALGRLLDRQRPDVVHTHGYRSDVVGGAVARRHRIPAVTTVHGFTGGGPRNRFYEWMQTRAYRRCAAVVAVSRPLAGFLSGVRGLEASRVHLVPNAWRASCAPASRQEARARLGLPENGPVIGWVGRLSREKGADVLVDALAHLRDLPLLATMIGDGPQRGSLERRAESQGLGERIRWCGTVPAAGRLFAAFDVFVLSSRTEGTPIVLFEAMAAGVPIVATAVGGVPDVVSEGEAALVGAPDPKALASAVRRILERPGPARRRAEAACLRLKRDRSPERWIRQYEHVYEAAARSAALPHPAGGTGAGVDAGRSP
ncbi:MAG: glycosyltransferase family 4 protein [Gemmatimonadota bacterium]